jgi:hypothetical protein
MADTLRELFEEMVADEPPLRTTTDSAAAAGRRLRARRRTLWTVAAAAAVVAMVTAVPTLAATGRHPVPPAGSPRPTASAPPTTGRASTPPTPTLTDPQVVGSRYCPSTAQRSLLNTRTSDGSILPDVDRAAAAVLAAAPRIAPGKQFILRVHSYIPTSDKWKDRPQVALIFDVGDGDGFGFVDFQIYTEQGVPAAQRAQWELDGHLGCLDIQRRDFPDGSVAVCDPDGQAANTARYSQVYYFAARGYDMNITSEAQGWSSSNDPNVPPPPPSLPVRTSVPLTVAQTMELADVVAHA